MVLQYLTPEFLTEKLLGIILYLEYVLPAFILYPAICYSCVDLFVGVGLGLLAPFGGDVRA